jgi:DNA-binding NarL/FixJ family response regulator
MSEPRAALRARAICIDRLRRAADVDGAPGAWRGMIDGRWSVVDVFEADGRRFFIARENTAEATRSALTAQEHQVLVLVCEGRTNKYIEYELGLPPPRVSAMVRALSDKLGATHRAELIDLVTTVRAPAHAPKK